MLRPRVFEDDRGFFFEAWNKRTVEVELGIDNDFVQDNHSSSARGVLRGLHYQVVRPQGKLVRVSSGSVFDVAVDLRRSSPTYRRWVGTELSAGNGWQLWVPPGFAHGFLTLSARAEVQYKVTDYYVHEYDRSLRFDDPELGIEWPEANGEILLSDKDGDAPYLIDADVFE